MYAKLYVDELKSYGVPEFAIEQLKRMGSVSYTDAGRAFILVFWATLIAMLALWLVMGVITTWIFTAILHKLKIAPWQIWK